MKIHTETRPRYVARPNEQAFAPPYQQDGCVLHLFALPADRRRMQALVDRFLHAPSRGRVAPRVLADRALVYFCDFARSSSHDPIDAGRGWLGEREFGVWIPIVVAGGRAPTFFTHVMVVDSGPAMCSGREVLGFPKEIGVVRAARGPAPLLAVDVLAQGEGRGAPGSWQPLLELERLTPDPRPGAAGLGASARLRGIAEALDLGAALLGVDEGVSEDVLFKTLATLARAGQGRADFLNLKQFRAAGSPTAACYQAIVRASARLRGLPRLAAAGEYAYRIHPRVSHPLADELGLAPEGRAAGIRCAFDFDFEAGEELR